jgi:hypothetical protein
MEKWCERIEKLHSKNALLDCTLIKNVYAMRFTLLLEHGFISSIYLLMEKIIKVS